MPHIPDFGSCPPQLRTPALAVNADRIDLLHDLMLTAEHLYQLIYFDASFSVFLLTDCEPHSTG